MIVFAVDITRRMLGVSLSPIKATTRARCKPIWGNKNIQHTVRYTELSPTRFKDFWRT
jgi:hypothetical protein